MTQKFMKIYPTADDVGKIPIVIADTEGLNGVSIEYQTVSQLLTSAKYKGEINDSALSGIDTSEYTGGEWIIIKDIPTIKIWSANLEEWV